MNNRRAQMIRRKKLLRVLRLLKPLLPLFIFLRRMTGREKVWDITKHRRWGNSIAWFDFDNLRLTGHTTPRPSPGDILHCQMESGKVGEFRFLWVDQMLDPEDMWFADMEGIGYLGEKEER